ncbi:MAG: pyrimidine/purine nucleoside phosphorylase [Thiotrichaceae bacterium]
MFKTNEYFDGKVISIAYQTETLPATVGVMAPGDYTFNTADKEKMTVVSGSMTIKRHSDSEAITFATNESFDVEENSSFEVTVHSETAYLCLYG